VIGTKNLIGASLIIMEKKECCTSSVQPFIVKIVFTVHNLMTSDSIRLFFFLFSPPPCLERGLNSRRPAPAVEGVAPRGLAGLRRRLLLLELLPAQDTALVAELHQLTGHLPTLREEGGEMRDGEGRERRGERG